MIRKLTAAALSAVLLFSGLRGGLPLAARAEAAPHTDAFSTSAVGYQQYQDEADAPFYNGASILLQGEALLAGKGEYTLPVDEPDFIEITEGQSVRWDVLLPETACYQIWVTYEAVSGGSGPVELELKIDGKTPFRESAQLTLERYWKNKLDRIESDAHQNDIRPTQMECILESSKPLGDSSGYTGAPFAFRLEKGQNQITLNVQREALRIRCIEFRAAQTVPAYAEISETYKNVPYGTQTMHIQGEAASRRNDSMLLPVADRSSTLTEPYKGSKISLNTIGGASWAIPGQEIVWTTGEIEQDGLYELRFRSKQNYSKAFYSNRSLKIDGEIPFAEAENLQFTYDNHWYIYTLTDNEGKPCLFHLTPGKHEISLTVTLGELSVPLGKANGVMQALNGIYSEILMITGANPDINRDYSLERELPAVIAEMELQADALEKIQNEIKGISGLTGSDLVVLDKLSRQLRGFAERPYEIPERFASFKNNIASLSTWIMDAIQRPLSIDYIDIAAPGLETPPADDGFWGGLWHGVQMFFASFTENYDAFSVTEDVGKQEESIKVWIATSRDYAQVLSGLIRTDFTPRSGVNVDLQLVTLDSVMPSISTGSGPDVWINAGVAEPINYATRKAVADLSQFADLDEVLERFYPAAVEPFRFEEGVYALPETQGFLMMFTRTDILDKLGLEKPQTWNELIRMLPTLSNNHMGFLLDGKDARTSPGDLGTNPVSAVTLLCTLLYQNGGEMYGQSGAVSALDQEIALQSFQELAKFYTNYGMPLTFDTANRFRSSETPIVISNYSLYNNLMVYAPEIRGLWEMSPIPGTQKPDGTIDRSVRSVSSGAMILEGSTQKQAAWDFLKWWTDAPTQTSYAKELESIMGPAARLQTANKEALAALPWSKRDFEALSEQIQWAKAMPEVPGGYFTSRHVENALRSVVLNGTDPRETLLDYVRLINGELELKREEFGLPSRQDGEKGE